MHATAFSPVLIHTVLEEMKKQMCSDGQLAAVDLKWRGPIPREHAFDGRPRTVDPGRPNVRCRLLGKELEAKTEDMPLAHELLSAMPRNGEQRGTEQQ